MRLSVVFELLLVFLFLAFAAARVIDPKNSTKNVSKGQKTTTVRQGPPNRYCACTSRMCNCCRDFSLPVVPIKGPGCASIMYVQRDTMMVTMSFGDRVLSNTTITGKTPKPICMSLPGGISQFCGRIYGISRKGDQFRACLGLELRALDDIEAALRVSCFKFGPKGVKLESAPPVPAETGNKDTDDDDDDDDYDLDDDDDDLIGFEDDEDDGGSNEDNEVDSDSVDYTGFSVLGEDLLGTFFSDDSGGSTKKKKNKKTAKPQVAIPKVSSTTRRPVLNIRRSTVKPVRPTVRPQVNRVTVKRPRPGGVRPQIVKKPSTPALAVVPQIPVQTTSSPTIHKDVTKAQVTTTPTPSTTVELKPAHESQELEKQPIEVTELPVTFTIPTETTGVVKNEVILPQMDLEKVEAVAAIAQQDVASGVISSSSLTSDETGKPSETVTVKYEKITPEATVSYVSSDTEKINPVKFVPTSVVTSRPSAEMENESAALDVMVNSELATNSQIGAAGSKNKITTYYQTTTEQIESEDENKEESEEDESGEEEEEEEEEGEEEGEAEEEEEEQQGQNIESNKVHKTSINKTGNLTIISVKQQSVKHDNVKDDDEDDIFEGVLSDEEDEAEEDSDTVQTQTKRKPINKNQAQNDDESEEDDSEELDILGEPVEKKKPQKVAIKKKPPSVDDEDEDDILSVLEDDDDDDDDEDDEESEDDSDDDDEPNKNKVTQTNKIKKPTTPQVTQTVTNKKPSTGGATQTVLINKPTTQEMTQNILTKKPMTQEVTQTILTKKPVTQEVTQTILTKKPVTQTFVTRKPITTTEKVLVEHAAPEEQTAEMVTEKVFIYHQPVEKVTEKVIMLQRPANTVQEQTFVYKEPANKISQETGEKIFIYHQPGQTFADKFVIYQEPVEKITGKPAQNIPAQEEETNEEAENDEESSEEETDDEGDSQPTLFASIIKDRPGFSNKYAEEHDLTVTEDLDIEDSDDDGNDFEEDRKLKQKKPITKSVAPVPKPEANAPKILSLTDLIRPKKYYDQSKDTRPISSSRTHRRMNLDRFLEV